MNDSLMSSKTRKLSGQTLGVALLSLVAAPLLAIEGTWQIGVNAGISDLSPDTDGSGFSLDDDQSSAFSVYFGYDITPIFSAELAYSDLGEAELSGGQEITYEAISLGATAYVWGNNQADNRSDGLSAYVRLGVSSINNESDIALDDSDNIALWAGAGVQYPVSDNFGLRAEVVSYDGDAQALLGGIYWRPGSDRRRSAPVSRAPAPVSAQRQAQRPEQPAPSTRQQQPVEQPRIAPSAAQCPPEAAAKIADATTCTLLNSTLAGVDFSAGTATLLPSSTSALTQLARAMQSNPSVILEIQGHTENTGSAQAQAQLASQRVRAVALFLVQNGVPVARLSARAFGSTQPLPGRSASDRIELRSR